MHLIYSLTFMSLVVAISCTSGKKDGTARIDTATPRVIVEEYGRMSDGKVVNVYIMTNRNGLEMKVINYGGIVTSLKTPDKNGNMADIVLGYDSLSSYQTENPYFGALIGRFGNRIADGKFSLSGQSYTLAPNDGSNHLHGGIVGFDKVFWTIDILEDSSSLKLSYLSKDGEEGYPGNLSVEVVYRLTDENEWRIDYAATTDKPTIVNLTQHTYFNLSGRPGTDILGHTLQIEADEYLPVNETLIPTGEREEVKGTPFDFSAPQIIGARINGEHEQLKRGGGYDHCWVLNNYDSTLREVAALNDSVSGRTMTVYTTEPGLQFYSGNFLDGTLTGKHGVKYAPRTGLCLETQHFPNSPNEASFPSVVLSPGEAYRSTTVYKFD